MDKLHRKIPEEKLLKDADARRNTVKIQSDLPSTRAKIYWKTS